MGRGWEGGGMAGGMFNAGIDDEGGMGWAMRAMYE